MNYNEEIFGKLPDRPTHLSLKLTSVNEQFCDGALVLKNFNMELEFDNGRTILPFSAFIPKAQAPFPAVVIIGKDKDYSTYCKKWTDKGYVVIYLYYGDISEVNGNFKSGISAFISPTRRKKSSAGKITVFSWAAIRALECAEVFDEIDKSNIGVAGNGIFGLSAILAKEVCDRFTFVSTDGTPQISKEFIRDNPHFFCPK